MNEKENWKDWAPQDEELNKLLVPGAIQKLHPNHPLIKLHRALRMNMIWGVIILILYVAIMVVFPYWPILLAMLITCLFNIYVLATALVLYKSIGTAVSATRSVLEELKQHHRNISKWGRVQQQLGLLVYPFAAFGGYLSGGILGSGKSVEVLFQQPIFIIVMLITILVLVPLGYWLAKWLFNKSFGKQLHLLEGMIASLEMDK